MNGFKNESVKFYDTILNNIERELRVQTKQLLSK